MARRGSLRDSLRSPDDDPQDGSPAGPTAAAAQETEPAAPALAESTSTPPAQPAATPTRGRKGTNAGTSSGPAPTRRTRSSRTAPAPAPDPAPAAPPAKEPAPAPQVLAPAAANAKRVGLYLHPDDYRALGLAKLDDGADANARLRAMIALWRASPRYRTAVDKLARNAPRGPAPRA